MKRALAFAAGNAAPTSNELTPEFVEALAVALGEALAAEFRRDLRARQDALVTTPASIAQKEETS